MRVSQRPLLVAQAPCLWRNTPKDARLNPEDGELEQEPELGTRGKAAPAELPVDRKGKGYMDSRRMRGFSMIELIIVISLILVVSAISAITIQPALREGRVTEAYNRTLMTIRKARDYSVAQRQIYFVTLANGVIVNGVPSSQITVTQGSTGTVINTVTLPTDITFDIEPGIPTSQTVAPTTPDGFGVGGTPIDFDQGIVAGAKNVIYFYPDGSAADALGNVNNGVVYIARAGEIRSSRAITLWGATGRLRGWHLYPTGATYYWRQQ
jgi:prepilin-type N-terminal cleavage/methylation domain-containing protein